MTSTPLNRHDPAKDAYNFYLSQLRIRVEMSFGRLVGKWGILQQKLCCSLKRNSDIIVACGRLHNFFKLYAFILLSSTLVPGINDFVVTSHPLHQLQVRKRSSSSCYMIETYNTRHRFPCY